MTSRLSECTPDEAREILARSSPGDDPAAIVHDDDACWRIGAEASAAARLCSQQLGIGYLSWYGVVPGTRGRGYGRRLLAAVRRWAVKAGCTALVTYTVTANYRSNHVLLRAGYVPYHPESAWCGWEGVTYWMLSLEDPCR